MMQGEAVRAVHSGMAVWEAMVLGLVEGITEYLPISSTGHLILASALLGLDEPAELKSAVDSFNIVIQGGAILAVLGLYWPRVYQMIRGLLGKDAVGLRLAVNIIIAFIPAAVLGVLFNDQIEAALFNAPAVLIALALGGIFMIVLDYVRIRPMRKADAAGDEANAGVDLDHVTPAKALLIGLLQCVAMWPGTSRSMMTIAGGVLVGLRPKAAAEFSFLLGLPTLGGACVFSLYKNLQRSAENGTPNLFEVLGWAPIIAGVVVATVSAVLAVRWLVAFLTRHGLAVFGIYRLVLCVVLGGMILSGVVRLGPSEDVSAAEPDAVPVETLEMP